MFMMKFLCFILQQFLFWFVFPKTGKKVNKLYNSLDTSEKWKLGSLPLCRGMAWLPFQKFIQTLRFKEKIHKGYPSSILDFDWNSSIENSPRREICYSRWVGMEIHLEWLWFGTIPNTRNPNNSLIDLSMSRKGEPLVW